MKRAWLAVGVLVLIAVAGFAGEVGFLEDFALAPDRTVPLKQLIPGTQDYYFYHCLQAQHTGKLDEADTLLKAWTKRHGRTARVREIENRQALLRYKADPKGSLEFVRQRLGIQFNHQRRVLGQKPTLPTALDPKLITREAYSQRALQRHPRTLDGFDDRALDWLIATNLNPDLRRHLLHRLARPDYPNLVKLVVDDLNHKHSRGFGSHPIHRQLLLDQLEAALKLKPDLLNGANFVNTYLAKLRPGPDADWEHDAKERQAYLERLWAFVSRLSDAHNSLKAHVLYHRLAHDRAQGVYDKARFMTYLKLPRRAGYVHPDYLKRPEHARFAANLRADYRKTTLLPPIGNDEPLVRGFLMHFFVEEDSFQPYAALVNDVYLKECFAETKIVNGLGDMEQWYSMLPPARYQALKERVDIDFAPTNKTVFGPAEAVALDLSIKNVKTLLVKVFEINALNYYRTRGRRVDTGINLDGLVANEEKTHTYAEPPLRRVKRHFEFPALKARGVYVVEFIGNGMSSRALIRKGRLQYLVRTGTAGHVFTVLDEANARVPDAALWLGGHRYAADKDGTITVPFSNRPGRQPIILTHGSFACLERFSHEAEKYRLSGGIYVDREALLKRSQATVAVRPALHLNGTPVSLAVLEEPTLVIASTDRDGVSTTKEVPDFKLHSDRESTYALRVPENLTCIAFTVRAKVQNLSQNKKVDLNFSRTFRLNRIDETDKIEAMHVSRPGGQYVLDVLGKTGEPKPNRPVQFKLKHRDFRDAFDVSLQSDAKGRVALGPLDGIEWIGGQGPEGVTGNWYPARDVHSMPSSVHGRVGQPVRVPYMGSAKAPERSELSLLETRGGTFVADRFAALKLGGGFIEASDLPAGDYDLLVKASGKRVSLRITQGDEREGYVLSANRHLEVANAAPLQIAALAADAKNLTVRLANASKFARVHVLATRYVPEYPAYAHLSVPFGEPYQVTVAKAESLYVTGRDIGDEYRYILERKYAKKFPGNMLQRPSLLLNPWAIRKTETTTEDAREGGHFGRYAGRSGGGRGRAVGKRGGSAAARRAFFANLDFLAEASVVLANLRPDAKGVVSVPLADLGGHHQIRVLAIDPQNTVCRQLTLPESALRITDLRLADALDPKGHFTEQKRVSVVQKGKSFVLPDITTSTFEVYDSLAKVYRLYGTLNGNPTLTEFGFILEWPTLKPERKRELYSKYACHELSFFLARKDPDFFKAVVLPYLRNKKDKTFLDEWLLGDDVSGHLAPWAYGRLNVVERVLLGRVAAGERPHAARHVADLLDLLPPDVERFNHLFGTALKSRALETGDELGVRALRKRAEERKADAKKLNELAAAAPRATRARGITAKAATRAPAKPAAAPAPAEVAPTDKKAEAVEEVEEELAEVADEDSDFFGEEDLKRRKAVRQLYRKLDKTQEWVENNYYHLPIEAQNAKLITVNAFWNDYAQHDPKLPFYSVHLAEASRNFAEMMLAMAVLDLPFTSPEHKAGGDGPQFTLEAGNTLVVFHKEIREAKPDDEKIPILVSQNFFRHGDRYRHVHGERREKYVADEFLVHIVYGCHVVVTNPTASPVKLDVLLQIPRGAIPVANGHYTRSRHVALEPYRTQTFDYLFYFPGPGSFSHYPVHVARNGRLIAAAQPATLSVVEKPTKIDTTSWDYISQNGTPAQVIAYLEANNLGRTKLDAIAWRMRDVAFFRRVLALLAQRHAYNHTLWSYGIHHNDLPSLRQYLQHADAFVRQCGAYIDTPPLTIDPVVRRSYEHREYWPLVNARAHRLGKTRSILNNRFYGQYMHLMNVLAYRPALDDEDLMSVTCYLLTQDRVEEALAFFGRVRPTRLGPKGKETQLQYDYFKAYIDLYTADTKDARAVAARYAAHPVDRWRKLFTAVSAQIDEIEGKAGKVVDTEDRTQLQTRLAATEASFEFEVEARTITLHYQNLRECVVRYYLMDIELLFSRNPFVRQQSGQFAYIRPNAEARIALDPAKAVHQIPLPAQFHSSNVMVEITAGGVKKAQPYTSNALTVQVIENYGQVKVTQGDTGKALPKTYVKVYARRNDGRVKFYKDGYTDLRGRFDYTSLNTNEIDITSRFALLVVSDAHGAVVREVAPPKR